MGAGISCRSWDPLKCVCPDASLCSGLLLAARRVCVCLPCNPLARFGDGSCLWDCLYPQFGMGEQDKGSWLGKRGDFKPHLWGGRGKLDSCVSFLHISLSRPKKNPKSHARKWEPCMFPATALGREETPTRLCLTGTQPPSGFPPLWGLWGTLSWGLASPLPQQRPPACCGARTLPDVREPDGPPWPSQLSSQPRTMGPLRGWSRG